MRREYAGPNPSRGASQPSVRVGDHHGPGLGALDAQGEPGEPVVRRHRHHVAHVARLQRIGMHEIGMQALRAGLDPVEDDGVVMESLPARAERPDRRLQLDAALEHLPDGARQIFVLHDVEGYKHEEIATLLAISSGTSKAQLHRARMLLRKRL